jgi:hypothetical protein
MCPPSMLKTHKKQKLQLLYPFVYIGEIGTLRQLQQSLHEQKLHVAPTKRDNVAGHCCCSPCSAHVISERSTTPSFASVSSITPALTTPTTSIEPARRKILMHWDSELLDGWHLECVPCHKPSGELGRLRRKAQHHHLSHDDGLVCQKLVDCHRNVSTDSQTIGVVCDPTGAGFSPRGAGSGCGSSLGDCYDRIVIGAIIAFHDIVDYLAGLTILT